MSARKSLPVVDSCDGCGACCRHLGYPSYLLGSYLLGDRQYYPPEPAWVRLPKYLKLEVLETIFRLNRLRDQMGYFEQPCIWLTPEGTCKHYRHQPEVCREFEVGGEDCLRMRREHGIGVRRSGQSNGPQEREGESCP
jgi:uncharacterized protein